MDEVTIYTDGGCSPNPGKGAWAALLLFGEHEKEISACEGRTTSNRMELQAVIEALRALKKPCRVTVFTDSQYVRQGMTEWMPRWIARGWYSAKKKPIKNRDLWEALHAEAQRHEIDWRWVKGHAGNPHNERVDALVRTARGY